MSRSCDFLPRLFPLDFPLAVRIGLSVLSGHHRCRRGTTVIGKNKERWHELCEQAAVEQDPKKMLVLVREINKLLEEKRVRLNNSIEPED